MGIITTTMIAETRMTMTTTVSTEEALAAVADRDDAIGGDEASSGKTTIKKMAGVRLVMTTGQSKRNKNVDDNVDNVRRHLPKTQQTAIGRGGEATTKTTQRNSTAAVGG